MNYDDYDDEGDDSTYPCSECGASVWSDAESCPQCGYYQTDEDWGDRESSTQTGTPTWIKLTALVLISLFVLSAVLPLVNSLSPPVVPSEK